MMMVMMYSDDDDDVDNDHYGGSEATGQEKQQFATTLKEELAAAPMARAMGAPDRRHEKHSRTEANEAPAESAIRRWKWQRNDSEKEAESGNEGYFFQAHAGQRSEGAGDFVAGCFVCQSCVLAEVKQSHRRKGGGFSKVVRAIARSSRSASPHVHVPHGMRRDGQALIAAYRAVHWQFREKDTARGERCAEVCANAGV